MQYQSNDDEDLQYRIFDASFNLPAEKTGRRRNWFVQYLDNFQHVFDETILTRHLRYIQ